jgi:hypothetical protein
MLETAGLVVQMNGASQAKSLSGRPKTDPLTDHLGVFSQLAGRVLMGLLRGCFVPPKADHVGFASLSGRPEHGGPEPTRPVTMCDWGSSRLGTWLARDKGGSAPEHLAEDDEGT